MQLGIESGGVDDTLAMSVFALEQHGAALLAVGRGWCNGHSVAEEVPYVGPELQESFISSVFGLLDLLQTLGCFGAEPREDTLGRLQSVGS